MLGTRLANAVAVPALLKSATAFSLKFCNTIGLIPHSWKYRIDYTPLSDTLLYLTIPIIRILHAIESLDLIYRRIVFIVDQTPFPVL